METVYRKRGIFWGYIYLQNEVFNKINFVHVADPMWVIVTVVEEGTMALTQQLSSFSELGASPQPEVAHNPFIPQRSHLEHTQVFL